MIVGGIISGIKSFFTNGKVTKFKIYDTNVLTAQTATEREASVWLEFDGVDLVKPSNSVELPTQPLENGTFTNDTVLDNPYKLSLICWLSRLITSADDIDNDKMETTIATVDWLMKSSMQLVILKSYPLAQTYTNLHISNWDYAQTDNNNAIALRLDFTEVRVGFVADDIQPISDTNVNPTSFAADNTSNPAAAKPIDNGFVTPANPTGDISTLGQTAAITGSPLL